MDYSIVIVSMYIEYMIHFYCLAVETGFYSDVVECLPVDPASWVGFPAGAGKIFSLYDIQTNPWYRKNSDVTFRTHHSDFAIKLKIAVEILNHILYSCSIKNFA